MAAKRAAKKKATVDEVAVAHARAHAEALEKADNAVVPRVRLGPIETLNGYQDEAMRTAASDKSSIAAMQRDLAVLGLGLTGEAGEVADLIKKQVGHGHDIDTQKVALELGDALWYLAVLADRFGFTLSEVATANVKKLKARYPAGWSPEASRARVDVNERDVKEHP